MRRTVALTIIAFFVFPLFAQQRRVSIAVAGLFHSNRFIIETAANQPLIVHIGEKELTVGASSSQSISIYRDDVRLVVRSGHKRLSGPSVTFSGRSGDADFLIVIPGRFRRRYRGTLTFTPAKAELIPVVEMDLETAVASVVASEAPPNAPIEALKALAVSARSYLVAGTSRHPYSDFCDTTHCQFLRSPPLPGSSSSRAAAETTGLVLTFSGAPFAAMYSASCSGRTHTLVELGLPDHGYPYYAVECPYCRTHPDRWTSDIAALDRNAAPKGERERLALARQLGWSVLPSNDFRVDRSRETLHLSGTGHGHGLGLCERGAAAMARDGSDFRTILAHYYPNTVVDSLQHDPATHLQ